MSRGTGQGGGYSQPSGGKGGYGGGAPQQLPQSPASQTQQQSVLGSGGGAGKGGLGGMQPQAQHPATGVRQPALTSGQPSWEPNRAPDVMQNIQPPSMVGMRAPTQGEFPSGQPGNSEFGRSHQPQVGSMRNFGPQNTFQPQRPQFVPQNYGQQPRYAPPPQYGGGGKGGYAPPPQYGGGGKGGYGGGQQGGYRSFR